MTDLEKKQYLFSSIFYLANVLQTAGDGITEQLSLKQWFLLDAIYGAESNQLSIKDIAARSGSSRQNTKKMLDLLQKKGFVVMSQSSIDKRATMVSLTAQGLSYLEKIYGKCTQFIERLFEDVDVEAIDTTNRTIIAIFNNLERMQ